MLINLERHEDIIEKNVERCRQKGITLPTFREMMDPRLIGDDVKKRLKNVGLWDVDPVNLYRITWHNEPKEKGGLYGGVNFIEIPRTITGECTRSAPRTPVSPPPWSQATSMHPASRPSGPARETTAVEAPTTARFWAATA